MTTLEYVGTNFKWLELIHKASPTLENSKSLCLVILSQMIDYLKPKT